LERRVKERWWPQDGFAGVITDSRITWKAHASLAYGSQLCLPLTDEDWGEIAGFGMPYEGKVEWLRGNYRRSAATSAAERWTDDRPERWVNLADAIPTKLPPAVVRAIAGHVKTADLFLPRLLGRLLDERHMTALRELAKISGQVGEDADRYVARAGDFRAQGRCLDHLIGDFGTPKSIHADDLRWTDGILDARLLPKLFEALVAAYRHRNADYNDAMTPIHEAIRRIDGLDAVRRYDELMASEPPAFPGVQFERYERDTILDDILRATGEEATAPLLATLGLPRL
jgi:hypothetical protein